MAEIKELRAEINAIDKEMARLYERRMSLMGEVAAYKASHGLDILDRERERSVLETNSNLITDPSLKGCYKDFMQFIMDQGKGIQRNILEKGKKSE